MKNRELIKQMFNERDINYDDEFGDYVDDTFRNVESAIDLIIDELKIACQLSQLAHKIKLIQSSVAAIDKSFHAPGVRDMEGIESELKFLKKLLNID